MDLICALTFAAISLTNIAAQTDAFRHTYRNALMAYEFGALI